jgi:hypothetical protein
LGKRDEADAIGEEIEKLRKTHDCMFIVQAQREGDGDLPVKRLWFDKDNSWQYFVQPDELPKV